MEKKNRGLIIVVSILLLSGIISAGIFHFKSSYAFANETEVKISEETGLEVETETSEQSAAYAKVGLDRTEVSKILHEIYDWKIKVVNPDSEVRELEIDSLIEDEIKNLENDIFADDGRNDFSINLIPDEAKLNKTAAAAAQTWNVPAIAAELVGYDTEKDELILGKGVDGLAVDTEQLKKDITEAIRNRELDKCLTVKMDVVKASRDTASNSDYRIIGTFTTNSTSNENRNTNLDIACKAINGTVLKPGEEFSFNQATGNRTAEKGYKAAKAYRDNGVVVDEEGGGVCQVSSTLYNAVVHAGIKVNERHAHTYEPSYVTPGEDAMVSYDGYNGPDLKFTNTTTSAIVIKAKYSNRTVTCSIIGIPVLADNEKVFMDSKKIEEGDVPTQIVEDPAVEFGTTVVKSSGSPLTIWQTDIVRTVNGEEVSRERLHNSKYRGHKRVVHTNTQTPPEEVPAEDSENTEVGPSAGSASENVNTNHDSDGSEQTEQ